MSDDNQVIGWDDEVDSSQIQEKKEFIILPDGEYNFRVAKVEKGQYNGSQKMPACGMVKVGMVFSDAFQGESYVTMRFFMVRSCLWKIYEFLTAIGLHKPGSGAVGTIPWGKVDTSCTGRAKLSTRTYEKDGKTVKTNDVEKFLAPIESEEY